MAAQPHQPAIPETPRLVPLELRSKVNLLPAMSMELRIWYLLLVVLVGAEAEDVITITGVVGVAVAERF